MITDEQLDKECELALQYKGPMTDEHQRNLIRLDHLLIDRVEQNFNFMFDAIEKKRQLDG